MHMVHDPLHAHFARWQDHEFCLYRKLFVSQINFVLQRLRNFCNCTCPLLRINLFHVPFEWPIVQNLVHLSKHCGPQEERAKEVVEPIARNCQHFTCGRLDCHYECDEAEDEEPTEDRQLVRGTSAISHSDVLHVLWPKLSIFLNH